VTAELKNLPELKASAKVLRQKLMKMKAPKSPEEVFDILRNFIALDQMSHTEQVLENLIDMDGALAEVIDQEDGFLPHDVAEKIIGVFAMVKDLIDVELEPLVTALEDDIAKRRIVTKVGAIMHGIALCADEIAQITGEPSEDEPEEEEASEGESDEEEKDSGEEAAD
jgi:hypothetical protein